MPVMTCKFGVAKSDDSPDCICGETESVRHYIEDCELYESVREKLRVRLFQRGGIFEFKASVFLEVYWDNQFSPTNAFIGKKYDAPKPYKTGTTIAGIVFKDGVVLGADTRATEDTVVADKNCSKIHYLAENMYCCGAGTAADTEMTTQMISSQLQLHKLNTSRTPRVCTANRLLKQMLFRYQGYISAALVLGGVDVTGPHLYSIHPHGSTDKLPYVTMGSGSLAAMATFEDRFKPNMEKQDAMKLVRDAIAAGIFNDLGSGSNIDLCVITKDKVEFLRPYDEANLKGERAGDYSYKRGSTAVLTKDVQKIPFEVVSTEQMDTA